MAGLLSADLVDVNLSGGGSGEELQVSFSLLAPASPASSVLNLEAHWQSYLMSGIYTVPASFLLTPFSED